MSSRLFPTLMLAGALLLGGCQAPVTPIAPPSAREELPYTVLNPQGPFPADLHELDIIGFQTPVSAPLTLPVTYRRGVEEQISWEGSGQGTAELWNEHGQLIYRVREGGAPQTLTVSAGRYHMVITPDSGEPASAMLLVAAPEKDGAGLRREILDLAETGPLASLPRGEADACEDATSQLQALHAMKRELDDLHAQAYPDVLRERKLGLDYLLLREYLGQLLWQHGDRLRTECGWSEQPL